MRAAGGCSSAQGSASGSVRVERAGERGAAASSAGKGSGAEEGWLRASGLAGQASTPAPLCSLPLSKPQLRLPQSGVLRSALWQTRKTLCVRFLLVTEFVVAVTPRKPTQGSRPTRHTQRAPLRMTLPFDPWPAAHDACVFSAGSIAGCLFEKGYVGLVCRPRPRFPGSRGGEGHVRVYRGARSGVPLILPQAWRTDPPACPRASVGSEHMLTRGPGPGLCGCSVCRGLCWGSIRGAAMSAVRPGVGALRFLGAPGSAATPRKKLRRFHRCPHCPAPSPQRRNPAPRVLQPRPSPGRFPGQGARALSFTCLQCPPSHE